MAQVEFCRGLYLLALLLVAGEVTSHGEHEQSGDAEDAVSDLLDKNGLPAGLFPTSLVSSYHMAHDGTFQVNLTRSCYAKFDDLVWYDKSITGKMSYGKIEELAGIQAKEYFIWLPVTGIHVDVDDHDTGYVYFEVGPLSKKLEAAAFEEPPLCTEDAPS